MLSPWDQPGMLKRPWCLFEISCSKKVSVAISRAQKDAFVKTLRDPFTWISFSNLTFGQLII